MALEALKEHKPPFRISQHQGGVDAHIEAPLDTAAMTTLARLIPQCCGGFKACR